jgi:hypothetical protein
MKLLDMQIADDILDIVNEEVTRIKNAGVERNERDMLILEKVTKVFSMISANTREALKAGTFGDIPDKDLEESQDLESAVGSGGADDNL